MTRQLHFISYIAFTISLANLGFGLLRRRKEPTEPFGIDFGGFGFAYRHRRFFAVTALISGLVLLVLSLLLAA